MIYYIWVINMASRYQFSDEEIKAIEQARRENKDKRAEARLKALELRAKGASSKDVAEATGFCSAYVSQLVAKYRHNGLEAISGNHYGGNHRNMSVEEEAAILAPFKARAEKGELVEISEIAKAYQSAVDHPVSNRAPLFWSMWLVVLLHRTIIGVPYAIGYFSDLLILSNLVTLPLLLPPFSYLFCFNSRFALTLLVFNKFNTDRCLKFNLIN